MKVCFSSLWTENSINYFHDVLLGSVRLTKLVWNIASYHWGWVEQLTTANWAKLNFIMYGGILTLTHSHLYHYWHFPTTVGFCHCGNMPASHGNRHPCHCRHYHHHHYCDHFVTPAPAPHSTLCPLKSWMGGPCVVLSPSKSKINLIFQFSCLQCKSLQRSWLLCWGEW